MLSLRPKPVDFEQKWSGLHEIVNNIMVLHDAGVPKTLWNDAFGDIYEMCVAIPEPLGDQLYQKTKEALENHARQIHADISEKESHQILEAYHGAWKVYFRATEILNNLYSYLNKQHIRRQKYSDADLTYGGLTFDQIRNSMMEIGELCLEIWRREVMEPQEGRLVAEILRVVAAERAGNPAPHPAVLNSVILSFVDVQRFKPNRSGTSTEVELYESMVEGKYVEATSEHYKAEAALLLQTNDVSQYMKQVMGRIEEETGRSRKYLHPSSVEKVKAVCQQVMVAAHRERFNAVAKQMVHDEQRQDLGNMYSLLKPIASGLDVLVGDFEAYARKLGKESVTAALNSENIPQQFVENVLKVWQKLKDWVHEVFLEDQAFVGAMDKALQAAVNFKEESRTVPKASEWLAKFCDVLLKKGAKGLSESEIDQRLSNAIIIFRYIEDKDIFQKFYSRMLAQRLIHGLSVSMDAEENMINKLKNTCGYEFTSKLQRMFTDIGLSRELTDKVVEWGRKQERPLGLAVQMQVLQAGAWPLTQPGKDPLSLPQQLVPSVKLFEDFYAHHYSGRKLTWLFSLASAEVKLHYLDKQYMITLPLHHLAILLHFEEADAHSVSHLALATQLSPESLEKSLRSLIETGLLNCPGKVINQSKARFTPDIPSIKKIIESLIDKQ